MERLTSGRSLWRLTPQASILLLVAAISWVAIIVWSQGMGTMSGDMGLELPAFVVVWTVMMAAMMLPSVAPVASLYSRSIVRHRGRRLTLFTTGYLVVWAAAGVLAFALGVAIADLAATNAAVWTLAGVTAYIACGVYQLSPLKYRCLRHCRSPLSLFFHYSSYQGRLRDLRVGIHHGAYCLGCCWGLMVVLLALGAMSIVPMIVLATVVLIEKLWSKGEAFSRIVGVVCLVLAVATVWYPGLAPGFQPAMASGMSAMPSRPICQRCRRPRPDVAMPSAMPARMSAILVMNTQDVDEPSASPDAEDDAVGHARDVSDAVGHARDASDAVGHARDVSDAVGHARDASDAFDDADDALDHIATRTPLRRLACTYPPRTASIALATSRCRASSTWPLVLEVSVIEECPSSDSSRDTPARSRPSRSRAPAADP